MDFKNELLEVSNKIDISLTNEQVNEFEKYKDLLLEWNEKINLTAIVDEKGIIIKHFIDSLVLLKYINGNKKVIDIGTGAGFPGIPLKIANDDLDITLLDSLNKRINFLNTVIKELDLNRIEAIHGRTEEFGGNKLFREKYDLAVARAVAKLNVLAEYCLPYVKVNGFFICMKGPNIEEELLEAKNAINVLGGKIEKVEEFTLPEIEDKRSIIIIRKIKGTPKGYPRKAGTPANKPIV